MQTNEKKTTRTENRSLSNFERPILSLRNTINDVFDNWFESVFSSSKDFPSLKLIDRSSAIFNPNIDMSETSTDVIVTSELPGMLDKDIDVIVKDNMLTIKGEKKEEKEEKKRSYFRQERYFGSFERSISLPCEVKMDKVTASFKNGILTVTLPKSPTAQNNSRHVTIKST